MTQNNMNTVIKGVLGVDLKYHHLSNNTFFE